MLRLRRSSPAVLLCAVVACGAPIGAPRSRNPSPETVFLPRPTAICRPPSVLSEFRNPPTSGNYRDWATERALNVLAFARNQQIGRFLFLDADGVPGLGFLTQFEAIDQRSHRPVSGEGRWNHGFHTQDRDILWILTHPLLALFTPAEGRFRAFILALHQNNLSFDDDCHGSPDECVLALANEDAPASLSVQSATSSVLIYEYRVDRSNNAVVRVDPSSGELDVDVALDELGATTTCN